MTLKHRAAPHQAFADPYQLEDVPAHGGTARRTNPLQVNVVEITPGLDLFSRQHVKIELAELVQPVLVEADSSFPPVVGGFLGPVPTKQIPNRFGVGDCPHHTDITATQRVEHAPRRPFE